jgi:hypothetical protein
LEAKGLIASYEGTLYASLTLKGVERIEALSDSLPQYSD